MTNDEAKLKRQEYLQKVLEKFTTTEPKLLEREIAEVIVWQSGDLSNLIKQIKKEIKK
jgi:hypothetical protein